MTSTEAQNSFGRMLDTAARNQTVMITKHGAAQAVVMSVDRYRELSGTSAPDLDALTAEFDALLTKVKQKQAGDPRIDLDDHTVDDQEVVKIHSFYVHHLLPLTVEVQWWEFPSAP